MSLTCLPHQVSQYLRVHGPYFRHRHQLVFNWLLVLHLLYGERANLKALTRRGPVHLSPTSTTAVRCVRPTGARRPCYGGSADQALQAFPPPADGVLSLVGDSPLKGKRGPKHPVAQKTRLSLHHPYVFGFRIVILRAHWGVYRIPVDCARVRRKGDPGDQTENALFRQMLQACRRPAWCQKVVVVADAASASHVNLTEIQELGYWYVMALPRTWKFTNGKMLQALVTHLPRWWYTQIRLPTINGQHRRAFWVSAKRA